MLVVLVVGRKVRWRCWAGVAGCRCDLLSKLAPHILVGLGVVGEHHHLPLPPPLVSLGRCLPSQSLSTTALFFVKEVHYYQANPL